MLFYGSVNYNGLQHKTIILPLELITESYFQKLPKYTNQFYTHKCKYKAVNKSIKFYTPNTKFYLNKLYHVIH